MDRNYYYELRETVKTISIPISLYQSLQGKYFTGLSREEFEDGKHAWAGLINPKNSGVNLHINVFTVGNVTEIPFSFQVWLNPILLSGDAKYSDMVSPANTAYRPIPNPRAQFMYADNAENPPEGGVLIFGRSVAAQSTIVSEEEGKFICPPGGSFIINCLPPENVKEKIIACVTFGWWEDRE